MKKLIAGLTSTVFVLAMTAGTTLAAPPAFGIQPFEFVGAVNDCGPGYPAGTPGNVTAKWDNIIGNPPPSLFLEKKALTTDCSSAGATLTGVEGIHLTELNYDIKVGSLCTAGSPRFNVSASDGFHFIGGCANGTQTPIGTTGWTHVVFDPTNPAQAFPVIAPGATVNSIELILDEQGSAYIDNISVNNAVVGSPTAPTTKDDCKNGGWQNFSNPTFKNQGDCVSYIQSNQHAKGNKNK